jgi:hypothetical protein
MSTCGRGLEQRQGPPLPQPPRRRWWQPQPRTGHTGRGQQSQEEAATGRPRLQRRWRHRQEAKRRAMDPGRPVQIPLEARGQRLALQLGALHPQVGKLGNPMRLNAVAAGMLVTLQDQLMGRCYLVDTGASYCLVPQTPQQKSPASSTPTASESGAGGRNGDSCASAAAPSSGRSCKQTSPFPSSERTSCMATSCG